MAKDVNSALLEIMEGDIFEEYVATGDKTLLIHHLKVLIKCVGEAYCKQSVRVYGVNKLSTQQLIKAALAEQPMPQVEFEVRRFGKIC